MILIDTCVLIWLASDADRIGPAAAKRLNGGERVFVSAISAFEIGQKAARGGLDLPSPVHIWFPEILADRGIEELAVTGEIAARATLLPKFHHDPFDRIIIATAAVENLTVLTPDPEIRRYSVMTVW